MQMEQGSTFCTLYPFLLTARSSLPSRLCTAQAKDGHDPAARAGKHLVTTEVYKGDGVPSHVRAGLGGTGARPVHFSRCSHAEPMVCRKSGSSVLFP